MKTVKPYDKFLFEAASISTEISNTKLKISKIQDELKAAKRIINKDKSMNEKRKEQAKDELIKLLTNQVIDLTTMSKIELGDDVILEIKRLNEIINENSKKNN